MEARVTIIDDLGQVVYESRWPMVKGETLTPDAKATMAAAVQDVVGRGQADLNAKP